jgi:hypothetical protein
MKIPTSRIVDLSRFSRFGRVLTRPAHAPGFQELHRELQSDGWILASLQVQPGPLRRIHFHRDSVEIFIPISGDALLGVAPDGKPERIRFFPLTHPLLLHQNTWHEVVAITTADLLVVENARVESGAIQIPEGFDF